MNHRISLLTPVVVLALVACGEPPAAPALAEQVHVDDAAIRKSNAVIEWNELARDLVIEQRSNPFQAGRGYAILSIAQHNAIVAARDGRHRGTHPAVRAAIGAASVVALSYLHPSQAAALESRLDTWLADGAHPSERHMSVSAGDSIGRAAAAAVVRHAMTDRFFAPWMGSVPVGPGIWFSDNPPIGAGFGSARPLLLHSGSQFRLPPPPAFGSPEFAAALTEVHDIATTRTPEQDSIAKFWAMPVGTYAPPGFWNDEAARLARRHGLDDQKTAHLFALMNAVAFDAFIAAHDSKFTYWLIRPTQADPRIPLAIGLPNFPSYPSNHAAVSGGMAAILAEHFPADRRRLLALAEEAAVSRLYGAIHFRFDNDDGLLLGRRIARWAHDHDPGMRAPFPLD